MQKAPSNAPVYDLTANDNRFLLLGKDLAKQS